MLGILDKHYVAKERRKDYSRKLINPEPIILDGNSEEIWYCFVPSTIINTESLRRNILPPDGKKIVYLTHYVDMIVPNVEQTLENLKIVYENARARMLGEPNGGRINFLGVSLGNIFSIRLASKVLKGKVEKLVSLVGGSNLGLSAWDSIATSEDSRSSGCATAEKYEEILSAFAPSRHISGVYAEKVFARFGGWI